MIYRPNGRPPIGRRPARAFAISVIIAAIAIIGVVATASYTIFGNQLVSMNRVSREDLNLNLVRTAARVLASLAEDMDGDTTIELPAFLTGAGPTGGGVLPADFPGNRADGWGTLLGYCTWDNGSTNVSANRLAGTATNPEVATIMAIVSAGPNKTFETTCADAAANITNGDDLIMKATTAEATTGIGGESVWTKHSETMISYGEGAPGVARVGVGTATPSKGFVVHTSTMTDGIRVENTTSPIVDIIGAGAGNDGGQITLYNAGTGRARLDANGVSYLMGGGLGIGTDNPTNLIEVNRNQTTGTGALISNTDASAAARAYLTETSDAGTTTLETRSVAGGNAANLVTTAPTLNIASTNASGTLNFATGAGNVNRMTIDSTGRFGIGAAPNINSALYVAYEMPGRTTLTVHNTSGSGTGNSLYSVTNSPSGWGLYGEANAAAYQTFNGGGVFGFSANAIGVAGRSTAHIGVYGYGENSWGGHFTSNNGPGLYVQTNTTTSSVIAWGAGCGYSQLNNINYGFHTQCNMYAAGSYQGSDERLKENIAPLNNGTATLMKLRPVEFDWRENSDQYRSGHRHDMGLIAQEVKQVIPELVREVPAPKPPPAPSLPAGMPAQATPKQSLNQELGSFYAVEYTRLIPYLIKALQEQTERNDKLEARLAAVEQALAAKP